MINEKELIELGFRAIDKSSVKTVFMFGDKFKLELFPYIFKNVKISELYLDVLETVVQGKTIYKSEVLFYGTLNVISELKKISKFLMINYENNIAV